MKIQKKENAAPSRISQNMVEMLTTSKKEFDRFAPKGLEPIQHLYMGDYDMVADLLKKADIRPVSEVLDVGCGIGGLSRILAKNFGHLVTGIDSNPQIVEIAQAITTGSMLSDQVYFHRGSVLDMPLESDSFDAVFCQHLLVNIKDKAGAFKEFFRILKDGGKLILQEIVKGEADPIQYPAPWAKDETCSWIDSWPGIESQILQAGFEKYFDLDKTPQTAAWWKEIKKEAPGIFKGETGPHLLSEEELVSYGKTMIFNFKWNRVKGVEAVFLKKQS